jgi:ribosomal protein L11 methyltransferase
VTPSITEHPGWLEICIDAHPNVYESISGFLFDLGCTGIVTEDFADKTLKAYLPLNVDSGDIRNTISAYLQDLKGSFPELEAPRLTFNIIEDQDWNQNWRRFFRPDRITSGLMVLPAWEALPPFREFHIIRLDPGPAFGTGQHPTTRMCLKAMEKLSMPEWWTMLDVGTGSGILGIYGAKLGAKRVEAIDIDPEALRWAMRNVELNGLAGSIILSSTPLEKVLGPFSLVAANLTFEEILTLFPQFKRVVSPGGWLILSGILEQKAMEVEGVLDMHGFIADGTIYEEEWACLISKRKDDQ